MFHSVHWNKSNVWTARSHRHQTGRPFATLTWLVTRACSPRDPPDWGGDANRSYGHQQYRVTPPNASKILWFEHCIIFVKTSVQEWQPHLHDYHPNLLRYFYLVSFSIYVPTFASFLCFVSPQATFPHRNPHLKLPISSIPNALKQRRRRICTNEMLRSLLIHYDKHSDADGRNIALNSAGT